jgi:hypothetical protein
MEMPKHQRTRQCRKIAKKLNESVPKARITAHALMVMSVVEEPGSVCGTVSEGDSTIRNFRLVAMALFRDRLPLDFRRLASPVKDRRFLDIVRLGTRRRIFGGVPYRLCGCV